MKNRLKIHHALSAALAIALAVCLGTGCGYSGGSGQNQNQAPADAPSSGQDEDQGNAEAGDVSETAGEGENGQGSYDNVTSIVAELDACNFSIEPSADGALSVTVDGEGQMRPQVSQDGGTLTIACHPQSYTKEQIGSAVLYYPEGLELDSLDIFLGDGTSQINTPVKAQVMDVSMSAGEFHVGKAEAAESSWMVGAGTLTVDSLWGEVVDLECNMGEMEVCMAGSPEDYDYELESNMGELTVGGTAYDGVEIGKQTVDNENSNEQKITAFSNIGSITVTFQQ